MHCLLFLEVPRWACLVRGDSYTLTFLIFPRTSSFHRQGRCKIRGRLSIGTPCSGQWSTLVNFATLEKAGASGSDAPGLNRQAGKRCPGTCGVHVEWPVMVSVLSLVVFSMSFHNPMQVWMLGLDAHEQLRDWSCGRVANGPGWARWHV